MIRAAAAILRDLIRLASAWRVAFRIRSSSRAMVIGRRRPLVSARALERVVRRSEHRAHPGKSYAPLSCLPSRVHMPWSRPRSSPRPAWVIASQWFDADDYARQTASG